MNIRFIAAFMSGKVHRILLLFVIHLVIYSAPAQALLPFQSTGNLYVSMWSADEVAVFSADGTPVERFSTEGLDGPRGIAFNPANGEIWIASEFGDAIFIFDHNHRFLRTLEHPDFDQPVGVTFRMNPGVTAADQEVYISNSDGNEIMVFDQSGRLLRRFTGEAFNDPNCSAFMADGSLFVANRLGGTSGAVGAVSRFDADDNFEFDFTTDGIASLMAVARDPNDPADAGDDTLWATSGAGANGIYEFDANGNLITTLLPADIGDGRAIVPQGIAFREDGSFYVVSFLNEVLRFDGDGNFLMRFPTGAGTARSTAFQACSDNGAGECVALGVDSADTVAIETGVPSTTAQGETVSSGDSGGGGASSWLLFLAGFCYWLACPTRLNQSMTGRR